MKAILRRPIKCPNQQIPFTDPRIHYPMYASIKYDGFRGTLLNGGFFSPEMKPFANKSLWRVFEKIIELAETHQLVFDGEVWHPGLSFDRLSSVLRKFDGDLTGVEYHIFDCLPVAEWNSDKVTSFMNRRGQLLGLGGEMPDNCRIVHQEWCINPQDAEAKYAGFLAAGHEGVILRSPLGKYKNNRCTHLESNCYKFKHFQTDEAQIIAVIQRRIMRSDTDRTFNPYGLLEKIHTESSYDLDEAVGAFQVRLRDGTVTALNLGRGFSYEDRRSLWQERHTLVGKIVEYKSMPHGAKNLPRIGNITRFRHDKASLA